MAMLTAARAYFEAFKKPASFIAGESYIPVTTKVLDGDDLAHLIDASLDLWLTAGRFAQAFETRLSGHFNRRTKALLVNSGSSANLVATSALSTPMLETVGLKPIERGAEIITCAAGFPTTVNPIVQNGWVPVFVDTDLQTLNPTFDTIVAARTNKTRAVILAHTLGNPFEADNRVDD